MWIDDYNYNTSKEEVEVGMAVFLPALFQCKQARSPYGGEPTDRGRKREGASTQLEWLNKAWKGSKLKSLPRLSRSTQHLLGFFPASIDEDTAAAAVCCA